MRRVGSCRIRRTGLVASAVAIAFALWPSVPGAAAPGRRAETRSYSGYLFDWVVGRCGERIQGSAGAGHGPMVVFDAPRLGGTSVEVVISDRIPGQRVMAVVNQTGRPWAGRIVCGRTQRPLPVRRGKPIFVHLFDGVSDGGPSVVSGGTVTATFFEAPANVERERSG